MPNGNYKVKDVTVALTPDYETNFYKISVTIYYEPPKVPDTIYDAYYYNQSLVFGVFTDIADMVNRYVFDRSK